MRLLGAPGGQVVVGVPPSPIMEDAANASPFGMVMAGRDSAQRPPALSEHEARALHVPARAAHRPPASHAWLQRHALHAAAQAAAATERPVQAVGRGW